MKLEYLMRSVLRAPEDGNGASGGDTPDADIYSGGQFGSQGNDVVDDDASGGGDGNDGADGARPDDDDQGDAGNQQQQAGGKGQGGGNLTPDQLQELSNNIANSFLRANQQTQQQTNQQRQLTPEEINKTLRYFQVTPDLIKDIFGLEEVDEGRTKKFQSFVNSIVENATGVNRVLMQHLEQKVHQQYSPLIEYVNEIRQQRARDDFFNEHKDLKPFEDLVQAVATNLSDRHPDGRLKTLPESFKEVSQSVRNLLKKSGIDPKKLGSGNANRGADDVQQQQQQQVSDANGSGVPAMAQLAGSGRSNAGGQGNQNNKESPDAGIYARWR